MCVPGCHQKVVENLNRREFIGAAATAAVGLAASACSPGKGGELLPPSPSDYLGGELSFSKVIDLTHPLSPSFPTYMGKPQLEVNSLTTIEKDGYATNEWVLVEHTGTHLDAPMHFSKGGWSSDKIPPTHLVAPLAVVDIRSKAIDNPDAQVTVADLKAWEAEHGEIPPGACVAMNSGWDTHVKSGKFRNADDKGVMHFPGFHISAVEFLLAERDAVGIAVDTLSLDYGQSQDFAVHTRWLPSNRWGLECTANLSSLPAAGACIVVGAPAIEGASGGPSRVFALL